MSRAASAAARPGVTPPGAEPDAVRASLSARFEAVRAFTAALAEPLSAEDQLLQSMADASPTKWHLAHTSWFFDVFVLTPHLPGWAPPDPAFHYLYNSYYNAHGPQFHRPSRGLISRPSLAEVRAYRGAVEEAVRRLMTEASGARFAEIAPLIALGLHHEQQHQELICTDIKHALSVNPLDPAAYPAGRTAPAAPVPLRFLGLPGGLVEIGARAAASPADFSYDNEGPRHAVMLRPYALANRPVTNGEFLAFIEAGGYETASLWLSDGWAEVQREGRRHPLYWRRTEAGWAEFTLAGLATLDPDAPVCHLGFYEADAFASFSGARLPTEAEWEHAAAGTSVDGHFLSRPEGIHPRPAAPGEGLLQLFGDVWEWTGSAYLPYPGYRAAPGAVGEYNGKFMSGQMVLRGGACSTPEGHVRASYRNFFPPSARWQFSGLRLARDA
ncbi:MAG: ergothioneine biosynthesis protein EgtB [Alphaproteobacteria bacterium]|nr:ergothioneine biosynthesis protein EgtB [Alphaproteobacteria bacterium]